MALGPFLIITHWWWSWSDPLWSKASCQLEWANTALQCKRTTRNLLRGKEILAKYQIFQLDGKSSGLSRLDSGEQFSGRFYCLRLFGRGTRASEICGGSREISREDFCHWDIASNVSAAFFPMLWRHFFSNVKCFFPSRVWIQRCPLDEKGG